MTQQNTSNTSLHVPRLFVITFNFQSRSISLRVFRARSFSFFLSFFLSFWVLRLRLGYSHTVTLRLFEFPRLAPWHTCGRQSAGVGTQTVEHRNLWQVVNVGSLPVQQVPQWWLILFGQYGVATISRLLILYVSFAEYRLFYRDLLQKRPILSRSLLIEATHSKTGELGTGTGSLLVAGFTHCACQWTRHVYTGRKHAFKLIAWNVTNAWMHRHAQSFINLMNPWLEHAFMTRVYIRYMSLHS